MEVSSFCFQSVDADDMHMHTYIYIPMKKHERTNKIMRSPSRRWDYYLAIIYCDETKYKVVDIINTVVN